MNQFQDLSHRVAVQPGNTGERWRKRAAGARIPAPQAAASILRSAWRKVALHGIGDRA
jgi:hypothetical protein